MSLAALQSYFLWCTVINYGLLLLWWVLMRLPHEWIYKLSTKGMPMTQEKFDGYNMAGIIFYKVAIIVFNLVPLIALHLVKA